MSRRRWLRASMWLAALVLFVWALSRVSFVEAWRVVGNLDARAVAALVAINLVALVVYGARWWILLRGLGHPIALAHAACYRLAGFGFAYFTPGPQVGGEPAQVVLVERRHRVPRDVAIASVMLDRLFDGVLNLAFLAAAALVVLEGRLALMLAVFVAVPLGYLAAITLGRKPLSAVVRAAIVHESERTAGRFCRERPVHLALAVAASFTAWAVLLFEYWALAFFLGVTLSPSELVIGLAAARVAYLLLFPAGLGVLEAGQVAAIRALGLPAALGLSLSLVIRLRDVIVASAGLWWGLRMLTRGETRETTRSRSSTASTSGGRGISRTR